MVNDIIVSSITSLFALFGSRDQVDDQAKEMLLSFLTRHFGIRDTSPFDGIYTDLRDLCLADPNLDKEMMIKGICDRLSTHVDPEEKEMILLRLMQFCVRYELGYLSDDDLFIYAAKAFGVEHELFLIFCDYVGDKETDLVHRLTHPAMNGHITTLWLEKRNRLLFTYHGTDTLQLDSVPILPHLFQTWGHSGVIKNRITGLRLYFSMAFASYKAKDNNEYINFCGRHIDFRFPNSDNGIHDFSFNLHSGELVAVMGGSGTGKSTLMSLLNGTLKQHSGTITINGHSIDEPQAGALLGFVPQDDLLVEELTVYENLWYTAKLCFEGMSNQEIDHRVKKVLRQLDLMSASHLKVGSPIKKYISGGQRKRLNIALELIREPAVLFLDEPTSGLSSADTEKVINILKELTFKGKLIIANIHQPSSDVYKLFDHLWILDKGGYPAYDGNPIDAISYFKRVAHYTDADTSACALCGNVNPEVILNIVEEKALDDTGRLTDERKMSAREWNDSYREAVHPENLPEPELGRVPNTDQKRPNVFKQTLIQLQRNFHRKISDLQYLLITLIEAPALAVVCAMLTHYAPLDGYTLMENKNLVSYTFMAIIVAIFLGMSGSAEEIIKDRVLLKREKFLNLSYASYISSKIVSMALVVLGQTFLFMSFGSLVMGLDDMIGLWWGILFLVAFLSGLTGLLLSQTLSSVVAIYITIPILLIPQILLCGLVVNFSDLDPDSTTGNVPAYGNVIPSRWAFEALAVTQFTDNDYARPLFQVSKQKYEIQYYYLSHLYEMQVQLETMEHERKNGLDIKPEHLDIIKKAIPVLVEKFDLEPYQGNYDYTSLRAYTDMVEEHLSDLGNKAALAEDNVIRRMVEKYGKEGMYELKRDHYNLQLENLCVNANAAKMHDIIYGHIVPRAGFVYLTPNNKWGGAPFYSSYKRLGNTLYTTLQFNVCILLLMCVMIAALLYANIPGKIGKKNQ